jgi:hypothetical protein
VKGKRKGTGGGPDVAAGPPQANRKNEAGEQPGRIDRGGTPRVVAPAVRADLLGLLGSELDPTHRLGGRQGVGGPR